MSTGHILILGAVAGATIFLGLPVGRVNTFGPVTRAGLCALATGILLFLFWDVLSGAVDPINSALQARHWGRFAWLSALGAAGFVLGLIGGGPTFFGTLLGQAWSSEAMSVVFFAVAAGSILYVVQELFAVNRKYGHTRLVTWLVLAGIMLGFATDFVVTAAGV